MSTLVRHDIHSCLRFAEELLKIFQISPTGRAHGRKIVQVLAETVQPAEVEFIGRELTPDERGFIMEGMNYSISDEELAHECTVFELAHIVYHAVNEDED